MSTQFYTQDQPATSQPGTRRAPRPHRDGPSWYRIAAVIIGAVAAAALIVLAISGLTGSSHPAPAPRATASQPASPAQPSANPAQPSAPAANPAQPTTPAVPPSAAVKTLQQQLGQLNYYEGPVDGIMGPQTTAAVKDLQRQAGLPQTGTMNPATQAALARYLAHGNNQMAGEPARTTQRPEAGGHHPRPRPLPVHTAPPASPGAVSEGSPNATSTPCSSRFSNGDFIRVSPLGRRIARRQSRWRQRRGGLRWLTRRSCGKT